MMLAFMRLNPSSGLPARKYASAMCITSSAATLLMLHS